MEQFNNGNDNITPPTMPVKRKPGRPRKEKRRKNSTEISPTLKYTPPVKSVEDANESLVGQSVTGVIEASFDAGFLVNVNIGNSGTCLRGVVFKPGHYLPVSADNDVAPHIQMINRKEIPVPKENLNGGFIGNSISMGDGLFLESTTSKSIQSGSVNRNLDNLENPERLQSKESGIPINSLQALDAQLVNDDVTNKHLDLESSPFMQPVNNNSQFQAPLGTYNNSRMGPMSMLLQVVQEKMVKPGDLK